jgi:hypothetical protein
MFSRSDSFNDDDILRQYLFSKVVDFVDSKDAFNNIVWTSIDNGQSIKDGLSDVYIYITNDRPILVNKIIEHELLEEYSDMSEHLEELESQDNYFLKLIIDFRKFIFESNNY